MSTRQRTLLFVLAALFVIVSITGCNTMEGFGKDIKNTGSNIENAGK